jgi:hypothetical protein
VAFRHNLTNEKKFNVGIVPKLCASFPSATKPEAVTSILNCWNGSALPAVGADYGSGRHFR